MSHDSSEIILICWFTAQETFITIKQWKLLCCLIFLWKLWYIFCQDSLMNIKFKRTAFIWNIIFWNSVKIFTVTFDQCNTCWIKVLCFLKKNTHTHTDPNIWMIVFQQEKKIPHIKQSMKGNYLGWEWDHNPEHIQNYIFRMITKRMTVTSSNHNWPANYSFFKYIYLNQP